MSGLPPGYNGEYRLSRDPKVQREILNGSWRDGRPQRYRRNPCFEGVNAEIIRKGQKLIDETQVRADYYRDEAAIEREQRIRKEAKYKNAILKAEQRGEARGRAHGYQRAVDEQELFDTGFRTAMDLNRRKSVKTAYGGGRSQKVSISRSSSISRSRHGPPSNENPRRHQHGDRMGQPACSRGFERPLKDYSVASLKDAASAHHKDPTNTNDHHNRRESRKPSYHTGYVDKPPHYNSHTY